MALAGAAAALALLFAKVFAKVVAKLVTEIVASGCCLISAAGTFSKRQESKFIRIFI